jgi:apolipoprotein N-acyltransferase
MPLIRAANTGISAAFDSKGRELGRIGLNRPGQRAFALPGALPETPYGRGGLWIPGILASLCLIPGLRRKKPNASIQIVD